MLTVRNQRWRNRRDSYRPAAEVIDTQRHEVAPIPDDTTAKAFVLAHHYSGSYPAARRRFGLYRGERLMGVAVFGVPPHPNVVTNVLPGAPNESLVLSRFVLLDEVPGNGETWFLARCFEQLRQEGFLGVVSFADPLARTHADGRVVFGGHVGTIYQAHNAVYCGRGKARSLKLWPDGTVLDDRAYSKLRSGYRGWRYTAALLVAYGAAELPADAADAERRAWAKRWVGRLTRRLRHRGNHKYVWALPRSVRKHLPEAQPYPKITGGT